MLFSAGLKERKKELKRGKCSRHGNRARAVWLCLSGQCSFSLLHLCCEFFIFDDECVNLISMWKQDETFEIRKEKYHGQQYCHIYFARLHLMRTLLYSLVPHWKPNYPGTILIVFLLSHPLRVI